MWKLLPLTLKNLLFEVLGTDIEALSSYFAPHDFFAVSLLQVFIDGCCNLVGGCCHIVVHSVRREGGL